MDPSDRTPPDRTVERLVLWDIDGTLVRAGDIGAAVFDLALEAVVGRYPSERVRMSGKTDPQIVHESLALLEIEPTDEIVDAVLRGIEGELAAAAANGELAAVGYACPGTASVLEALASVPGVVSTLLTGNVRPNALVKVGAFGLDRWLDLELGAYGSDHIDRNELVPIALSRLRSARGVELDPSDVWVVGDTPRDLDCARAGGARCLLVATGRYGVAELSDLGADAVFADLSDTAAVLRRLAPHI